MIQGKAFAPSIDSVNDRSTNNGRSDWLFHDVRSECGDGADDHRSSSDHGMCKLWLWFAMNSACAAKCASKSGRVFSHWVCLAPDDGRSLLTRQCPESSGANTPARLNASKKRASRP